MSYHMARGCHRTGVKEVGAIDRMTSSSLMEKRVRVRSTNRMCALYINSSYLKKKKKGIERK